MRRIILGMVFITTLLVVNVDTTTAQSVNASVNIGNQPAWGSAGYDYVGYYYFPDIDVYYDVNNYMFYYPNGGRFVSSRYLPNNYGQYDLYSMYKVVINQSMPWRYNNRYRKQYARYIGTPSQIIILNSPDQRFYGSRNNRITWVNSGRYGSYPYHNNHNKRPNGKRPNNVYNKTRHLHNNYNNRPNNGYSKPNRPVYSGHNNNQQRRPVYEPNNSGRYDNDDKQGRP